MFNLQCSRQWERKRRPAAALLGSLLALLTTSAAHAVTSVTVDGHPNPVTLTVGETVTVRFDVAKAGGTVQVALARDLDRAGKYDPSYPAAFALNVTDGGGQDMDPAPAKIAWPLAVSANWPAGPYLLRFDDRSDGSTLDVPGVNVAPKPEAQAISGQVAVVTDANPTGTPPPDAIVWAASDPQTLVASASIRPDGTYVLPLPPGTYILFAEWLGDLRSPRQVVQLVAGQQVGGVNLPLIQGQEVTGTVKDGGQPIANAIVRATAAGGREFATRTFADGSYVLVMPPGQYQITAPGGVETVIVASAPLDGVDFPALASAATPMAGTIVTVAGNGIQGFGGDGRRATAARVANPLGLVVDTTGNLYITDLISQRIRRLDAATGVLTTVAGSSPIPGIRGLFFQSTGGFSGDGGPATAAQLNSPVSVTVDRAGNLYLSDRGNYRVRKVDTQGVITSVAGTGKAGFSGDGGPATAAAVNLLQGLAVDAMGNLYLSDRGNQRVRKVSPSGMISTVAGGGTSPVTDGVLATAVTLANPWDIAVDGAGNLFILERGLNRILKVTPAGIVSTVAGTGKAGFSGDGGPATEAQIANPTGITVDSASNIYFGDQANQRVRRISPEGIITTVAGTGASGFAGDGGPATEAQLSSPAGVGVDAAGNLFIADRDNRRVRKVIGITAPGLVGGQ